MLERVALMSMEKWTKSTLQLNPFPWSPRVFGSVLYCKYNITGKCHLVLLLTVLMTASAIFPRWRRNSTFIIYLKTKCIWWCLYVNTHIIELFSVMHYCVVKFDLVCLRVVLLQDTTPTPWAPSGAGRWTLLRRSCRTPWRSTRTWFDSSEVGCFLCALALPASRHGFTFNPLKRHVASPVRRARAACSPTPNCCARGLVTASSCC